MYVCMYNFVSRKHFAVKKLTGEFIIIIIIIIIVIVIIIINDNLRRFTIKVKNKSNNQRNHS